MVTQSYSQRKTHETRTFDPKEGFSYVSDVTMAIDQLIYLYFCHAKVRRHRGNPEHSIYFHVELQACTWQRCLSSVTLVMLMRGLFPFVLVQTSVPTMTRHFVKIMDIYGTR